MQLWGALSYAVLPSLQHCNFVLSNGLATFEIQTSTESDCFIFLTAQKGRAFREVGMNSEEFQFTFSLKWANSAGVMNP